MLRGPVTGQRSDDDGVVHMPWKLWLGRGTLLSRAQASCPHGSGPGWQLSGCKEGAGGAAHACVYTRAHTEAHTGIIVAVTGDGNRGI